MKAEKTIEKESMQVTTKMGRAIKAKVSMRRGEMTSPVMVEKKMARSYHTLGETWMGLAMKNRTRTLMATNIVRGRRFTPPPALIVGEFVGLLGVDLGNRWGLLFLLP